MATHCRSFSDCGRGGIQVSSELSDFKTSDDFSIFVVSDGTGKTAYLAVQAALAQFDLPRVKILRFDHVKNKEEICCSNSKKLEGTFNSTLEQLTDYLNELRDLRAKALRDYKEIKRNTEDNSERIALEHIRFNALRTYENYHKMYLEALKLHLGIVSKMTDADNKAKKGSGEDGNEFKITRTDKKSPCFRV